MRLKESDGPRAFRSSPAFVLAGAVESEAVEHECKCGHYDTPDRFGFCRDEDCRKDRLVKALLEGKAQRLKDGTIIWDVT